MLLKGDEDLFTAVDSAVHLAAEALLSSFSTGNVSSRSFRPPEEALLRSNASILGSLVFPNRFRGYEYSSFRAEAMKASIPGSQDVTDSTLAISSNGYVAYSEVLESIEGTMTDKRQASCISVVPGSLRLTGENGTISAYGACRFERLVEGKRKDIIYGRTLALFPQSVQAFQDNGEYCGVGNCPDPYNTRIEHLIDSSDDRTKTLYLTTYLRPSTGSILNPPSDGSLDLTLSDSPTPASWQNAIRAIALSTHVNTFDMNRKQERILAQLWRDKGYFDKSNMAWCRTGELGVPERRYISTTSSNEQLRFFEAGYLFYKRKLYVQHQPPLIQCLKEAFAEMQDDPN
jgi:hypothetical protein